MRECSDEARYSSSYGRCGTANDEINGEAQEHALESAQTLLGPKSRRAGGDHSIRRPLDLSLTPSAPPWLMTCTLQMSFESTAYIRKFDPRGLRRRRTAPFDLLQN